MLNVHNAGRFMFLNWEWTNWRCLCNNGDTQIEPAQSIRCSLLISRFSSRPILVLDRTWMEQDDKEGSPSLVERLSGSLLVALTNKHWTRSRMLPRNEKFPCWKCSKATSKPVSGQETRSGCGNRGQQQREVLSL